MVHYPNKLCYVALLLIVLFDCLVLALTDAAVKVEQIAYHLLSLLPLMCFILAASKVRFTSVTIERICGRAAHFCQGLLFLLLSWVAVRLFNHLSMKVTADIGYADGLLARLDQFLLANWISYFEAVQANPGLISILDHSYTSLTSLSVIAFIALSCCRDLRRSEFFVEAFFLTAVICIVIGMFFPAQGTVMFHLGPEYDFSNFSKVPGIWFIEPLSSLRGNRSVVLDLRSLPGLVTFPSFHVAAALILAASFWRTRLLIPVLLYSCIVTAATPIFGGHYIVDLLGGMAAAGLIVTALVRSPRYNSLFTADRLRAAGPAVTSEALR